MESYARSLGCQKRICHQEHWS